MSIFEEDIWMYWYVLFLTEYFYRRIFLFGRKFNDYLDYLDIRPSSSVHVHIYIYVYIYYAALRYILILKNEGDTGQRRVKACESWVNRQNVNV